jgi:hypothetical protein
VRDLAGLAAARVGRVAACVQYSRGAVQVLGEWVLRAARRGDLANVRALVEECGLANDVSKTSSVSVRRRGNR